MKLKLDKEANHKTVTAACYIRDTNAEYIIRSGNQKVVPEVDTTGAGDAFTTGFLYGLLKGKELEECGRLGNIVAQFSISQIGAREGLPTPSQLAQRYQDLYSEKL